MLCILNRYLNHSQTAHLIRQFLSLKSYQPHWLIFPQILKSKMQLTSSAFFAFVISAVVVSAVPFPVPKGNALSSSPAVTTSAPTSTADAISLPPLSSLLPSLPVSLPALPSVLPSLPVSLPSLGLKRSEFVEKPVLPVTPTSSTGGLPISLPALPSVLPSLPVSLPVSLPALPTLQLRNELVEKPVLPVMPTSSTGGLPISLPALPSVLPSLPVSLPSLPASLPVSLPPLPTL